MTNHLELNWKLDGFVDEQRYYCSETQIDPANLPAPKAILANDVRSYVDASVEVGKTYYVAVGSVKNGVEKLSDVVSVVSLKVYRYYRIYITANTGGFDGYSEMQEIELAVTAGGVDITTPSTPANQSSYYASRTATKLVDNNFTGAEAIWTSANKTFPQWVSFDLGEQIKIAELRIYPTSAPWHARAPKDFIVQGSIDNANWIDIQFFSNVTGWGAGVPKRFNLKTGSIT